MAQWVRFSHANMRTRVQITSAHGKSRHSNTLKPQGQHVWCGGQSAGSIRKALWPLCLTKSVSFMFTERLCLKR